MTSPDLEVVPASTPAPHEPLRYLVLSGSARQASVNTKLAQRAAHVLENLGARVDFATVADFPLPLYDQDLQAKADFPAAAQRLRDRVTTAHALVISAPEYNASVSGVVKNAVDWLSRFRPQPFVEMQCLLMSASPSMVGGNRGLWALRVPLEHLGARVYPDMFSLAQAHTAFSADGSLRDERLADRFEENLESFASLVEAATRYPCIKRAWTEFLGEPVEPPVTAQAG
jgi:NAD(P)H-dependent FMN reductase